jgi:hypothetical protein
MRICCLAAALLFLFVGGAAAQAPAPEEVRVIFVRDGVFVSPVDDAWNALPETRYDLLAQQITAPVGGGSISSVSVRATHDGEEMAVRLQWSDTRPDRGVGVNTFRDAAAIGFPVGRPESPPSPFMGDPDHPVVIWQWAADFDANAEGKSRFGERYPHTEGVWIFPQDMSVRRKVRGWRGADPVIEYIAKGFGTLTPRLAATVAGISDWADGRWSVVLRRKLTTTTPEDAVFVPGEKTSMIIAIWDGRNEEVNGRKAVTYQWIPAKLDGIGSPTTKSDMGVSGAIE